MDGGTVAGTLLIVFLVLKLTRNIAWSWWWVLSPVWIDVVLSGIVLALMLTGVIAGLGFIRKHGRHGGHEW
jgi:Transmembrane Fragile-X-F protein